VVFEPREYRQRVDAGSLVAFEVVVGETDLQVLAERDLSADAVRLVLAARAELEAYLSAHPAFGATHAPHPVDDTAGPLVRAMAAAAERAGVGPMAAVAGAIAEHVARGLAALSERVVVENGGDLYLIGRRDLTVALHTGEHGATGVGLRLRGADLPLAVATSSGTFGHSHSYGTADTVTVLARDGALADAVATAAGNRVHAPDDVHAALAFSLGVEGVRAAVVTAGGAIGVLGDVELVPLA